MQLTIKADVMEKELMASINEEYTTDNIGMILHQVLAYSLCDFYVQS